MPWWKMMLYVYRSVCTEDPEKEDGVALLLHETMNITADDKYHAPSQKLAATFSYRREALTNDSSIGFMAHSSKAVRRETISG